MSVLSAPPQTTSRAIDITIYGAGIFGLSVAWSCLKRGARVQIIDPNGIGNGSSGGIVGALAPHVPDMWNQKKQFQFESLTIMQEYWREISEISGISAGYAKIGRIQPLLEDRLIALAESRTESARDLWEGRDTWILRPDHDFKDWAPATPTGYFVYDSLSARINPRAACDAIAKAVALRGGIIQPHGQAEGKVVWATGWQGLLELSDETGRLIGNGVKGQSALLDFDARGHPQLFSDGIHIIPHENGTVAIGSTSERYFDEPTSCDAQLDALIAKTRQVCPALKDADVIGTWANVRPRAKSRAPLLGEHPTRSGEFIANGGFKIGFGMAAKIGEVMAEFVMNNHDEIPSDFRADAL